MTLFLSIVAAVFVVFYALLGVVVVVVMVRDRKARALLDPDALYVPSRWVARYGG